MSADPEELLPADFGKYRLVRKIATGGMAEIFLAHHHERPDEPLVIKRILPNLLKSAEFVSMFLDEARIASQLQHENIVRIHDIGQFQGSYYISMEYVHGEDIRRIYNCAYRLQRSLPLSHSIKVIAEAARGLGYAHKLTDMAGRPVGLVHRDVSPQNILVTYEGGVKIVDFGIAKAATKVSQTRAGVLKGKYSYMSPEQAIGDPIDHRTDIFALGIILYETTTGTRLFKRHNELATLQAIIKCEVTPPTQALRGYPPQLEDILLKALARDPRDRFEDAESFSDALLGFLRAARLDAAPAVIAAFLRDLFKDRLDEEEQVGRPALPSEDEVREEMAAPAETPSAEVAARAPSIQPEGTSEDEPSSAAPPGFVVRRRRLALDATTPDLSPESDEESEALPSAGASPAPGSDPFAATLRGDGSAPEIRHLASPDRADEAREMSAARSTALDETVKPPTNPRAERREGERQGEGEDEALLPTMARELAYPAYPASDGSRSPTAIPRLEDTLPQDGLPLVVSSPGPERTDPVRRRSAAAETPVATRPLPTGSGLARHQERRVWPRVGALIAVLIAALLAGVVTSQIATSLTASTGRSSGFGRVTILTEPGATVRVGGDVLGTATAEGIAGPFRVPAGPHRVKVAIESLGFDRERAIEVQADRVHEFEIRGRKGWIAFKVHPWARVHVDGRDLGLTPLANVEVFEGTHQLLLENPEIAKRHTTEVRVEPSQIQEVKVNLNDVADRP